MLSSDYHGLYMLTVACQDVNSVTNHSFIDVSILRLICFMGC